MSANIGRKVRFISPDMNNFEMKLKKAFEWLAEPTSVCGGIGEKSTRTCLHDVTAFGNKLDENNMIAVNAEKTRNLVDNFCILIEEKKRNSNIGVRTASAIRDSLESLHTQIKVMIQSSNDSGVQKLSSTIFGKIEQINRWLVNPYLSSQNGIGEKAAWFIIDECRRLAISQCQDPEDREDFLKQGYETELLLNQLAKKLKQETDRNTKVIDPNVINIGKDLKEKFRLLSRQIKRCLIQQVADNFIDVNHPMKRLADIVLNQATKQGTSGLAQKFEYASREFLNHTKKLCNTAHQLASISNQSRMKQTIELINELTKRIVEYSPQVVNAAHIVFHLNANPSIIEHFDLMQNQLQFMMEHLQRLVDESLDSELFIKACENSIIRETFQTQGAVQEHNSMAIVTNALNIVRRSNRIVQIASQESDNSEEMEYVNRIQTTNEILKQCLPGVVQSAKKLAAKPDNKDYFLSWTSSNEKLLDSIIQVRQSVTLDRTSDDTSNRSSTCDQFTDDSTETSLKANCENSVDNSSHQFSDFDFPRPAEVRPAKPFKFLSAENSRQYKATHASRPTPLPDLIEEENESEFPLPQTNQPILMAAHDLHVNINQWCATDNDILTAAKRISQLMAKLSELVGGEIGTKKELIATAKQLADESQEISRIAKILAADCTDKRIRMNLLQVSERIPTIGTQLKILATVKATMLGNCPQDAKEDTEATEMLIGNAQNLNLSVKATVDAAKTASIKMRTDSGLNLKWVRRGVR